MTPLVDAVALEKHFASGEGALLARRAGKLRAVDGVSLRIAHGETLGLVGESGCGKSTLGRLLIRLTEPSAGAIFFEGEEITRLSTKALRDKRRAMQIIFQDPYGALNPRMSVEDIIMEPLLIHGAKRDAPTRQKVSEMLDLVGLPKHARDRFPHEFSGGQRQRIGIARALVLRPKLVVCDEPVSALDVSVQAQIVNLLQDLQSELRLTYLFIAHDLSVVKHISNRVAVMYLGKLVEIAEKRELYRKPLHPYTQALIAAVPVAHPANRASARAGRVRLPGDVPSALHPPTGCRFHTRCPHAMAICRAEEPKIAEPVAGHHVACHLIGPS
ncbi:MAG: ATP-binding cassette domain-containing protein [Hyphomicrobiales bacterium]|nr:ATP-binding cassette domain-containing protein [Hyphomicrobiales bacterium]